jgi:hypothetical protein
MRHINSTNNINKKPDVNKSDNASQESPALKAANAKLLQSMQSQAQSIRNLSQAPSQNNQDLNVIKDRNQSLLDFDKAKVESLKEDSTNTNNQSIETEDASGGSAYSGGFLLGKDDSTGYKGYDQSRANDWKEGKGIYSTGGAYSTYTGNGAENLSGSGGAGSGNAGNQNVGASSGNANSGGGVSTSDSGSAAGSANGYLQAAKALLKQIGQISQAMAGNANPIIQIAKNLTNKGLSEQAVAYLEAAQVDTTLGGQAINQEIILTKAQASTIKGDSDTNINYWKETLADNKSMGKATHDLAKMA